MALAVFPTSSLPGIAFPVPRTTIWSNEDQTAISGARSRYPYYSYPRYRYSIPIEFLRVNNGEFATLQGFINSQNGSFGLWLYQDTQDFSAAAQGIGTGDGTTTTFQLVRALGGFVEPVFFPDLTAGLITQVTVAGTPTTNYTVSSTGQIILNSAPTAGQAVAATFTFKWGCRFDTDDTEFSLFAKNPSIFSVKDIKWTTEKIL